MRIKVSSSRLTLRWRRKNDYAYDIYLLIKLKLSLESRKITKGIQDK